MPKKVSVEVPEGEADQVVQAIETVDEQVSPTVEDVAVDPVLPVVLDEQKEFRLQQLPDGSYQIVKMPQGLLIAGSIDFTEITKTFNNLFR